jgi:hypothetical protein
VVDILFTFDAYVYFQLLHLRILIRIFSGKALLLIISIIMVID